MINRRVKYETALKEHERALALKKEKFKQQLEAAEWAHTKLAFEKKLEQKQSQKETDQACNYKIRRDITCY